MKVCTLKDLEAKQESTSSPSCSSQQVTQNQVNVTMQSPQSMIAKKALAKFKMQFFNKEKKDKLKQSIKDHTVDRGYRLDNK